MELHKWATSFLVFTAMFLPLLGFVVDLNTNYDNLGGTPIGTGEYSSVYNTTSDIYGLNKNTKDAVFGTEVDEDSTEDSMFKGSYKGIRFIQSTPALFGNIISAIATTLGIPPYFITIAITFVTILIVFAVIYLIFRFQPR